jgi:AmiR/NasT family two-component response regulator
VDGNGDGEVGRLQLEVSQLQQALATRDLIGQAKGVLMATEALSADEAFRRMVRESQRTNRKLTEIAAEVVASKGRLAPKG